MSKTALLFPGQAAQFVGMGSKIIQSDQESSALMKRADEILGFELSKVMFDGPEELLKETKYTQPAVFVHSMLVYYRDQGRVDAHGLAGHSLGEISACVAGGVMSFEDGLRLVQSRAEAMQKACEMNPSTMAAILGLEDEAVEKVCAEIEGVVPANYNCPGQLVISGTKEGITEAVERAKEAGARRAMEIAVGGAFHSPLMQPALEDFESAISNITMDDATIPIYQNVTAKPTQDKDEIKENLIRQITSPVRWTSSMQHMIEDGFERFIEVGGKGRILLGMLRKISREVESEIWQEE